jgi:hypothetical protein
VTQQEVYLERFGLLAGEIHQTAPQLVVAYAPPTSVTYDYATADPPVPPADQATIDGLVAGWSWENWQPRALYSIFDDVNALTPGQRTNVQTDIGANQFAKVRSLRPPQDGAAMALHWAMKLNGATAVERTDACMRLACLYAQQNPTYLEKPAFDPTINVPGNEVVPVS